MVPKIIKYIGENKQPWYEIEDKAAPYNKKLSRHMDQTEFAKLLRANKDFMDEYDYQDDWIRPAKTAAYFKECLAAIQRMRIEGTFEEWRKSVMFDPNVGSYSEFLGEMTRTDLTKEIYGSDNSTTRSDGKAD